MLWPLQLSLHLDCRLFVHNRVLQVEGKIKQGPKAGLTGFLAALEPLQECINILSRYRYTSKLRVRVRPLPVEVARIGPCKDAELLAKLTKALIYLHAHQP